MARKKPGTQAAGAAHTCWCQPRDQSTLPVPDALPARRDSSVARHIPKTRRASSEVTRQDVNDQFVVGTLRKSGDGHNPHDTGIADRDRERSPVRRIT